MHTEFVIKLKKPAMKQYKVVQYIVTRICRQFICGRLYLKAAFSIFCSFVVLLCGFNYVNKNNLVKIVSPWHLEIVTKWFSVPIQHDSACLVKCAGKFSHERDNYIIIKTVIGLSFSK